MILQALFLSSQLLSILHVCGDDPRLPDDMDQQIKYSPRMWR